VCFEVIRKVILTRSLSDLAKKSDYFNGLIDTFDNGQDLFAEGSPLQLLETERQEFVRALDGDLYRQVPRGRLYVLLRLDSALSDGSAIYDYDVLSIEHVLPQTPPDGSEWCRWFPTQEARDKYVHRLGNLLLLSQRKNSSASNAPFADKKKAYFRKGGVSPFPLTTQALDNTEWTEVVVLERQTQLLEKLKGLWRL
jgi:Protein of unknown function (DUF1524)